MFDLIALSAAGPWADAALELLAGATALLAVAFLAHALLGRRRAPARSAVWNACLVGLLLLPIAGLASPRLRVEILPSVEPAPPALAVSPAAEPSPAPMPPGPIEAPVFPENPPGPPAPLDPRPMVVSPPTPAPGSMPSFATLAVGLYLTVVVLLSARLAGSLWAIGRLRRSAEAIHEPAWTQAMARWRVRLGVRRPVALLATGRLAVPVVVGWLRPAVLVPDTIAATASPSLIDAILLHELAHVRRGDYAWNLLRKAVQILYWPHPLAWLAGRAIASVREQACDDLCVHVLGGPDSYRESLLEVASSASRLPGPALGLAMATAGPARLLRRLDWIDRTPGAPRCLSRAPVRLALASLAAALSLALGSLELARASARQDTPPTAKAEALPAPEAPASIEVIVRAQDTGKPLPGAKVRTSTPRDEIFLTDAEGRVRIDLVGDATTYINLDIWADGYVQQRHDFEQGNPRSAPIPKRLEIDLLPGEETLGGTVTDEEGQPIAGVKVEIWGYLGELKQKNELAFMVDTTTDDQGRWRSRSFRAMKFAYLYLSHPNFVRDGEGHPRRHGRPTPTDEPRSDEKPMDGLRDFSDVQVMTRGVEVAGEVRDQAGQPVPGARVVWFEAERQNTMGDDLSSATTDDQGRFRFAHTRPGPLMLLATAADHAPEQKPFTAAAGSGPASIVLPPPGVLTGQVVDQAGAPVAEAFVGIGIWRGGQTLRLRTKSDADGRFLLEDTPADSFTLQFYKRGYMPATSDPRVTPGDEVRLTLRRVFTIGGSIRDATSRNRISEARVEVGLTDPATGSLRWAEHPRIGAFQGEYNADIDLERMPEARLRFLATGYKPHESRLFRAEEGSVTYEVALEPEEPAEQETLFGVVRRPDGSPLADAEVALAYPFIAGPGKIPSATLVDGRFDTESTFQRTTTDAAGRFRIARETGAGSEFFAVIVVHPDFFAEVDHKAFATDPTIVARPWGRIEGVARRGGNLLPGVPIRSFHSSGPSAPDLPSLQGRGAATADDQGRFVLDRVAPGEALVSFDNLRIETKPREGWWSGVIVDVEPGQTSRVDLGGTGRPVVATIQMPQGFDPAADYLAYSQFSLESDRPRIPIPPEASRGGSSIEWNKQWYNSPEGRAYRRSYYTFTQAPLQPDGTLRVDDVPPGDYRLNLSYTAEPLRGIYTQPERVARATLQFTIPEIPGGRTDEPFDLGLLRPKVRKTLTPNAPAPPFDVELLEGGRATLDDFKGKFLVLHYWSTSNRASLAGLAELKDFHALFAKDDRVALLSLATAPDAQTLRDLASREGLSWPLALADSQDDGGVLDAYQFDTAPAFKLINPDGTLQPFSRSLIAIESVLSKEFKKP